MESYLVKSQNSLTADKSVGEIILNDLNEVIHITIQTFNSTYSFSIVEPDRRRGLLSGGVFGSESVTALLTGEIIKDDLMKDTSNSNRISTGARAVFLIPSARGVRRMITSSIKGLYCTKK